MLTFDKNFSIKPNDIEVYIGPHIKKCCYTVGKEVLQAFGLDDKNNCLSLAEQAQKQLKVLGVKDIFISSYCTYHNSEQFYSYRKEKTNNRIMSLISNCR